MSLLFFFLIEITAYLKGNEDEGQVVGIIIFFFIQGEENRNFRPIPRPLLGEK